MNTVMEPVAIAHTTPVETSAVQPVEAPNRKAKLHDGFTDADELAGALKLDRRTVTYHARRGRFGAPVRADVHIYRIDDLAETDREALYAHRGQVADGSRDMVRDRRIFPFGEDEYTTNEKVWGRQASRYILTVEETRDRNEVPYPAAVEAVVIEEQKRVARAVAQWFPLLSEAGALDLVPRSGQRSDSQWSCPAYNNFRKWKEIWNRWRSHNLDDSQWWCLCPQCRVVAVSKRRTAVQSLKLTESEVEQWRYYLLHYESPIMGSKLYSQSPQCRPAVAAAIKLWVDGATPALPPSLERALYIPQEIQRRRRSARRFMDGFTQIRGAFYVNRAGEEKELLPGDLFEADDMTINTPFWCEWPWGGDPCADKFGVRVLRGQTLALRDVRSGKWLSFVLLARYRDSYRASDILSWIGRAYRDIGMPRVAQRFERGVWAANRIEGLPVYEQDGTFERRWAGIADLGTGFIHANGSKGKAHIEQGFDVFQRRHDGGQISVGRSRGEFERENKLWLSCRQGHTDPRSVFPHIDRIAAHVNDGFRWLNEHWRIRGRIQNGIPDQVWDRYVNGDRPLLDLPADKQWMFLPDYCERAVQDGALHVTLQDGNQRREFVFETAQWIGDGVGDGYRLAAFFDAGEPDLGAWVFNAEPPGNRPCNRNNWPVGRYLGIAPRIAEAPMFDLSGQPVTDSTARQRYASAFRLHYRALWGRERIVREATDGAGNILRVESADAAAPASPITVDGRTAQVRADRAQAVAQTRRVRSIIDEEVTAQDRAGY